MNGTSVLSVMAVIVAGVSLMLFSGCSSVHRQYVSKVKDQFASQEFRPSEILTEDHIASLPQPVRDYIIYSGAIGKPIPQSIRFDFDAKMWKSAKSSAMKCKSEQYNFFGEPARLFFMKASMFGVPARVLHAYSNKSASMYVRAAGLFTMVDVKGEKLSRTETVTVLNDMCFFTPSALIDERLRFEQIDEQKVKVIFHNGPHVVSAVLIFNEKHQLVNFYSDDRPALGDDGKTFREARWSSPVKDYKEFDGRMFPTYAEAIYHYPEGDLVYGKFRLRKIEYDPKVVENKTR